MEYGTANAAFLMLALALLLLLTIFAAGIAHRLRHSRAPFAQAQARCL